MSDIFHGEDTEVYWKLYRQERQTLALSDQFVTIICLQDFDERDYDQKKFIVDSKGNVHRFATEELAKEKLNAWFKPEQIDPKYLIAPE